jgi:hypothetical protein
VPPLASGSSGTNFAYISVELRTQNGAVVNAVKAQGIVDTGANMTCIPLKLIAQLGVQPVGSTGIQTLSGYCEVSFYAIDIAIERLLLPGMRVVGVEGTDLVLLGRGLLKGFPVVLEATGAVVLYDTISLSKCPI